MNDIKKALEQLTESQQVHILSDPIQFVHRYSSLEDQEIAGFFSAQLAYGRVTLFIPVLTTLFEYMDSHGGPRAWINQFSLTELKQLPDLTYRFNRTTDFAIAALALYHNNMI